jgi:lysozyme family protein
MVKARVTKEGVLEAIREHILKGQPIYLLIQESTGVPAYVFLPCVVESCALYVKVQLPAAEAEKDERLIVISSHPPKFKPPGAMK